MSALRPALLIIFLAGFALALLYPLGVFTLFDPTLSIHMRAVMFSLLMVTYALAQYFCGPLQLKLAVKHGVKKSYLCNLFALVISFGITIVGISFHSYTILIISRLLQGSAMGCYTVALADYFNQNEKYVLSHCGSTLIVAMGLGFTFGALTGGSLSSHTIDPHFFFSLPVWATILLTLIIFFCFCFRRFAPLSDITMPKVKRAISSSMVSYVLTSSQYRPIYLMYFFIMVPWMITLQFLSISLFVDFKLDKLDYTLVLAGISCLWIFGTTLVHRLLTRLISPKLMLSIALIVSMVFSLSIALTSSLLYVIISYLILGLSMSLCWTNCFLLAPKRTQTIDPLVRLSFKQAIGSISSFAAPLLAIPFAFQRVSNVYLLSTGSLLFAFIFVLFSVNKK